VTMQEEIKAGDKQTDVGTIPQDWDVARIVDVASITTGSRNTQDRIDTGIYPFFVRSQTVERINSYSFDGEAVLTAGDGVGTGKIFHYINGKFDLHQRVYQISNFSPRLNGFFFYLYFASKFFDRIMSMTAKSSVDSVRREMIADMLMPLPPPDEQRAIAEALADVDELIAALEGMIAKKRDLKQAAMQHLLTGKTRLPGFSGEWEATSFAEVVKHHAGNSFLIKGKLSTTESQGLYPCYSASGQDVWFDQFESEGDAIVVSAVGSRCGKAFRATGKWCAIANTHVVWPIRTKVNIDFLHLFLNDEDFWTKGGSGQPFVQFRQSFRRALLLPTLGEQTAIAEVLSDMDADLAALEAQAAKARAVKQGMMQELLTGRVRLV